MESNDVIITIEFPVQLYGARRNQHISYAMHKAAVAAKKAEEARKMAQLVALLRVAAARKAAQRAALRKAPQFCLCRAERELRWI